MRLELTRRADYAIRGALCLARHPDEMLTGAAIARETQMPGRFVTQVMGDLVRAGLVEARIGRSGGYRLAAPAAAISVLSVVEAVEGDTRRESCVLRNGQCRSMSPCEVHDVFARAQEALINRLSGTSLASVVRAPEPTVVRADEDSILVRRIQPSDLDLLPAFYSGLSEDSRYARFLGPAKLSDEAARSFCTPDHTHDEGFVAIQKEGGSNRVVGHLCLEPAGPRRLELAVAVSDDVQGKGIGRRLMEAALEWATTRNFEAILASAFSTNTRVLRLLTAAPYPVHVTTASSGVVDVVIPLVGELLPDRPVVVPAQLSASHRRRGRRAPLTVSRCSRVVWRGRPLPVRDAGG